METTTDDKNVYLLNNGQSLEIVKMPHRTLGVLEGNIYIPEMLCNAIIEDKWDEKIVKDILNNDHEELKFFQNSIDEVRAVLVSFCDLNFLYDVCNFKVISEISGDKLYEENKEYIKNYVQQGDWLFIPKDDKLKTVNVCNETKLRLVSHVYYKLLEGNLNDTPIRALEMGNASWHQKTGRRHIEFVSDDCDTILKAIFERNQIEALPYKLS
jgi:hypothetical protein